MRRNVTDVRQFNLATLHVCLLRSLRSCTEIVAFGERPKRNGKFFDKPFQTNSKYSKFLDFNWRIFPTDLSGTENFD